MTLRPDDRVLWLGTPDPQQVATLAAGLASGILVIVAPERCVLEGRKLAAPFENVMYVPEAEDGSIPWRDGFFTLVVSSADSVEVRRVLAPEGRRVDQGVFSW